MAVCRARRPPIGDVDATHLALLGELDRVADQIDQDLPQPAGIADQRRRARRVARSQRQLQALRAGRARPGASSCRRARRAGRSRRCVEVELARLDLREVENVVDDRAAASRPTTCTMSRYSRCSAVELGVERQLRHADDAVHRRADLVAHVGQEFALGAAGGLGRLLGLDAAPLRARLRSVMSRETTTAIKLPVERRPGPCRGPRSSATCRSCAEIGRPPVRVGAREAGALREPSGCTSCSGLRPSHSSTV